MRPVTPLALLLVTALVVALWALAGAVRADVGIDPPAPQAPSDDACELVLGPAIADLRAAERALAEREARVVALAQAVTELLDRAEAGAAKAAPPDGADGPAPDGAYRLAAVYASMDAAEAARLLETMDPAFTSGLLAHVEAETAAALLARMAPAYAYAVSADLANRPRPPAAAPP